MSFAPFPIRANEPEVRDYLVTLVGAGAAVPTKLSGTGTGITVARSDVGILSLTFTDDPGTFAGFGVGYGAATVTDLDGWELLRGAYVTATKTLPLTLVNESNAAADLPANCYLDVIVRFKQTAV